MTAPPPIAALVRSSLRRPWTWAIGSLLVFLASAPFAAALYGNLHTDLRELLPRGAPAAIALESLERRVGGLGHLSVVIQTEDLKAGEKFVDALGAALQPMVPGQVRQLYWRVDDEKNFLDAHGAFFADLGDLTRLRDGLRERIAAEKKAANPLVVSLDDDDETSPGNAPAQAGPAPEALSPELKAAIEKLKAGAGRYDHFIDGYLAGEGGHTLVMIVTPNDAAVGLNQNQRLFDAVDGTVQRLNPASFHPSIRVGYDGDVREVIEAQDHLVRDIGLSGILVLIAVALAIVIYYRRLGALPLLVFPLFTGASLSFAISRFVIHFLNPNTAFLGSIIIGNGINAGLILLARYVEERRAGSTVEAALPIALSTTWVATLAASGAAAASYGSLGATQFRGFNQFAFMGSSGMLLCWLSTYLCMPAMIVLYERWRPLDRGGHVSHGFFSRRLATQIAKRPGTIFICALLVTLGAGFSLSRFLRDPIEYDFSKLGSRSGDKVGAAYYSKHLDAVMQSYQTPTVILTNTADDAEKIAEALEVEKASEGPTTPIDSINTLGRLLPHEQDEKLAVLSDLFAMIDDRVLRALPADVRPLIERIKAKTLLRPVRLADLPARFTWLFHEKDGSSGRLVLVYPTLTTNSQNGQGQMMFARSLRAVANEAVPSAQVAGSLVLVADIVTTITQDGRFAALLSFGAVALLTLLALRQIKHAAWVLGSLTIGTLWMMGALGLFGLKLNFVNFVVLPITFGIGVDYAVNLYQRARQGGGIEQAVSSSGGAVALCSTTTIIGYATLLIADNRAIFSFGMTAVLGELTCLSAALVALPAALALRDRQLEKWAERRRTP